jgi:type VI protein secretion system component VasF
MSTNADQNQSDAWVHQIYERKRKQRVRRKLLHGAFVWVGLAAAILVTVLVFFWIANLLKLL